MLTGNVSGAEAVWKCSLGYWASLISEDSKYGKQSENLHFIPFGRFRVDRDATGERAAVLVGREGQRAFLIDALTGASRRGAYLITGRRGVGKTTFVENCLKEFEANVFRRYLRGMTGRSVLDLMATMGIAVAFTFLCLIASDLIEFLAPLASENVFVAILVAAAALMTFLPLLYGKFILNCMAASLSQQWNSLISPILFLGIIAASIWVFHLGSPAYSMLLAITVFVAFVPIAMITSLRNYPLVSISGKTKKRQLMHGAAIARGMMLLVLPVFFLTCLAWAFNIGLQDWAVPTYVDATSNLLPYRFKEQLPYSVALADITKLLAMWAPAALLFMSAGLGLSFFLPMAFTSSERAANANRPWVLKLQNILQLDAPIEGAGLDSTQALRVITSLSLLIVIAAAIVAFLTLAVPGVTFGVLSERGAAYSETHAATWSLYSFTAALIFGGIIGIFLRARSMEIRWVVVLLAWAVFVDLVLTYVPSPFSMALVDINPATPEFIALLRSGIVLSLMLTTALTSALLVELLGKPRHLKYLGPSLIFLLTATIALAILLDRGTWSSGLNWALGLLVACPLLVVVMARMQSHDAAGLTEIVTTRERRRLVPPVEALLLFKAVVFVGIGLQLSYPLVSLLPENLIPKLEAPTAPDACVQETTDGCREFLTFEGTDAGKAVRWPSSLNRRLLEFQEAGPLALAEGALSEGVKVVDNIPVSEVAELFTPFGSNYQDEGLWTALILLLALLLYFAEYEWIGRSFISQRQVRSLDRGPRRGYLFHHDLDPAWLDASMSFPDKSKLSEVQQDMVKTASRDLERQRKSRFRTLEAATFPYGIAKVWLPSLVVRVNLGFDRLDHRGVTHAMLFGLAGAYRRAFLSWRSPYRIVSSLFILIALLYAIAAAGRTLFDPPPDSGPVMVADLIGETDSDSIKVTRFSDPSDLYCDWLEFVSGETGKRVLVPNLVCDIAPDSAGTILKVLFAPLVQVNLDNKMQSPGDGFRPIFSLLHFNNGLPEVVKHQTAGDPDTAAAKWHFKQTPSLTFRVYHIAMLALLLWGFSFVSRRMPILPYRTILTRIETLMNDLVETRTERRTRGRFGLSRIVDSVFRHERQTEQSRDALDPRSVEIALMEVLEDIQAHNKMRLIVPTLTVSVPTPEVHFVFDELDKIGGVVDAEGTALEVGEADKQAVDSERRRTYELHALLSDMKRVISSAPARFIFVGGRALHDEWIRDVNRMGTRQPLLSSIFDAEIYLPSLLLDIPRSEIQGSESDNDRSLDLRVKQYLGRVYEAAKTLDQELQLTRILPFFASPVRQQVQQDFDELSADENLDIDVVDARLGHKLAPGLPDLAAKRDERSWLLSDLTDFLAFRSAGSPKRMRETLQQMIRPAGSYFRATDDRRFQLVPDRDMVVIDRAELYRLQFISYVFRHIDRSFGNVLLKRDDKVAINVFFLFDYLMKLHGRAFSLSSLERLDELAHIHRAPDLRRMLEKVIEDSVEKFFHRMLNGLYSYRFQSDLAMEIRYLSRMSEPEMAALNFTLDESHELKTTYSAMLSASGQPSPDIISALGELYEFDQAYDVARSHYERAIRMIDEEFERQVGRSSTSAAEMSAASLPDAISKLGSDLSGVRDSGVIDAILRGAREDRRILGGYMPWAVRRLRLMLQIGLTFEQAGDEERAQAQYHSAHLLARAITDIAFRTAEERNKAIEEDPNRWEDRGWLKLLLENLTLVFQPLMASAWVSEKLEGSVDTSLAMVERELLDLSRRFTFIRQRGLTRTNLSDRAFDKDTQLPKVPVGDFAQNFALLSAEMHNKAGDLYFFKGRPHLSGGDVEAVKARILATSSRPFIQRIQELKGYLPMARYQYCTAMHEVRRFVRMRTDLGAGQLNPTKDLGRPTTHREGTWPSFVHLTASSSLVDLGEMMRAGTTITAVLRDDDPRDPLAHWMSNHNELQSLVGKQDAESQKRRTLLEKENVRLFQVLEQVLCPDLQAPIAEKEKLIQAASTRQVALSTEAVRLLNENLVMIRRLKAKSDPQSNKQRSALKKRNNALLKIISLHRPDLLGSDYIATLRDAFNTWSESADDRVDNSVTGNARNPRQLLFSYLGRWRVELDRSKSGEAVVDERKIEIVFEPSRRDAVLLSFFFSFEGARQTSLGGLPLAAADEFEIVLHDIGRLTKNVLVLDTLGVLPKAAGEAGYGRANEDLIATLAETAKAALAEIASLRNLDKDPDGTKRHRDGYRIGIDVPVSLANKALGLILTLIKLVDRFADPASQARLEVVIEDIEKCIGSWFGTTDPLHQQKYDVYYDKVCGVPGQLARSRLLRMADRHMFPALSALELRKTLIDDVLLGPAPDPANKTNLYTKRHNEAEFWIRDLVEQNRLVDAPMHFTAAKMAETLALANVLKRTDPQEAIEYLDRAEQSFSMGRQYYKNISRLYYHFDDFNDRSRHSEHAGSMMQADVLAFFRAKLLH